jgi:malate permease and related proteins
MNEFLTVLAAVLPVFMIALAGVVIRKLNWLTEQADQSLLRVTINVLAPCLIFDSILRNDALRQPENVWLPPLVGFGTVALGIGLGLLVGRLAGLKNRTALHTFALCIGLYNYGYIPIPLVELLFDRETLGVLFVHNVGVEIALWTLGLMLVSGIGVREGWKRMLNPPVIAIAVALPLNFLDAARSIPEFLQIAIRMVGLAAIPIGVLLVGATMADQIRGWPSMANWRVVAAGCVAQLGLLAAFFFLLAVLLPGSLELKRVIVIQAAMPAAVFCVVLAKHYGGDPAIALRIVLATSLVSLITIPIVIRLGLKVIGT